MYIQETKKPCLLELKPAPGFFWTLLCNKRKEGERTAKRKAKKEDFEATKSQKDFQKGPLKRKDVSIVTAF